jgi:hypothetical protein
MGAGDKAAHRYLSDDYADAETSCPSDRGAGAAAACMK